MKALVFIILMLGTCGCATTHYDTYIWRQLDGRVNHAISAWEPDVQVYDVMFVFNRKLDPSEIFRVKKEIVMRGRVTGYDEFRLQLRRYGAHKWPPRPTGRVNGFKPR